MSGYASRRVLPTMMQRACWRNRCPDLKNSLLSAALSTRPRLAENADAGAAMARPSIPRPPALHQLHLGRTGSIGPERCQYDLLNPRRGIMMRLMQSMVPTQEPPRSSFSCPRWAWRRPSGPTAPRSGNMFFSHHPTRRMKFNPVAAGFFTSQPSSVIPAHLSFCRGTVAQGSDSQRPYSRFAPLRQTQYHREAHTVSSGGQQTVSGGGTANATGSGYMVSRRGSGTHGRVPFLDAAPALLKLATAAPSIASPHRLRSAVVERKNPRPS